MVSKDHIISEIKRVASENGGKAPGRQVFENSTGIKQSDWYGKYWVRWSEALGEAGYQANKLNDAYDFEYLYKQYAMLVRELGHIPVAGELRMKASSDKSFPAHTTFSRLGNKNQVVESILQFCRTNDGWVDVVEILERYTPTKSRKATNDIDNTTDGYVYLIKSGRHYKIGMTNDIHRRGREISIELPEKSETIHVISTDDPSGIEAYWHKRFSSKRGNGEWFNLTASDIKAFKRRKFM